MSNPYDPPQSAGDPTAFAPPSGPRPAAPGPVGPEVSMPPQAPAIPGSFNSGTPGPVTPGTVPAIGFAPYPPPRQGLSKWAVALIAGGACLILGGLGGMVVGSIFTDIGYQFDETGSGWGESDYPYPFDTEPLIGSNWEIIAKTPPHDATKEILTAYPDHAKPPAGMKYWILPIKATYVGNAPTPQKAADYIDMLYITRSYKHFDQSCGKFPNDLAEAGAQKPDDIVRGNLCVVAPADAADGTWGIFNEDYVTYLSTDGEY